MANVLVLFTEGVEEIECITVVDLLRRAGVEVCLASLDGEPVVGRSGITMLADQALAEVADRSWDMVVLPGGLPNATLLRDHPLVKKLVLQQHREEKYIAAICAAPIALAAYGLLEGREATAYPACCEEIEKGGAQYQSCAVVVDGHLITSRGAGTAMAFALQLVETLCGEKVSAQVAAEIVI